MFGLGAPELLILVVFTVVLVWPCWRICAKAGLPGPLGLISLIPGGLFVLLFVWAVVDWPVLRRAAPGDGRFA
jgi:hypothetical protein